MPRLKRGMTPIILSLSSRDLFPGSMPQSWPGLTRTRRNPVNIVMVRLVRAIHVFTAFKSWMPRLKRGMTDYKSVIPGFIPGIHATVMARLDPDKTQSCQHRHGPTCSGHPRLYSLQVVDAPPEAGHDAHCFQASSRDLFPGSMPLVMARLDPDKTQSCQHRHGPTCSGHPRLYSLQVVDAPPEAGHDGL